jgi:hypothetical protein
MRVEYRQITVRSAAGMAGAIDKLNDLGAEGFSLATTLPFVDAFSDTTYVLLFQRETSAEPDPAPIASRISVPSRGH